jgi:hypothetical protein
MPWATSSGSGHFPVFSTITPVCPRTYRGTRVW